MPLQTVVHQDLSKGSNVVTNPYVIGQQQSILLTNLLLDEHGSVRTRDGTLILTSSPDVAPSIRPIVKIYDFVRQDGTTILLAIVRGSTGNNQLYDRGTTPWTLIGTLGTKYPIPDILTFTNLALICNGAETPYSYDGTTLKHLTASSGTVPAGANHHTLHQGFYWLWNTAGLSTTSDGPSSLRSSDLNNPNSWPLANQLFIDKDDGDSGQGMGQFTIAESGISPSTSQIIFKQFKAFQMTGVFGSTNPAFAVQKIKSDMGCVAPRSISFAPGFGLIRMTHRGFALFDGVDDRLISEEIRPLIFGSTIYEQVDWAQMGTAYAITTPNPPLYLCAVPVCGITGLTRVFAYDLVRKAWTVLQYPNALATLQLIQEPVGPADTTGRGQVWTVDDYNNTNQVNDGTAVLFTSDLDAIRFHRGGPTAPDAYGLFYDQSSDGGATWPTTVVTALNNFAAVSAPPFNGKVSIQTAAVVTAQTPNVYLILAQSANLLRSTDLFTWTVVDLTGVNPGVPLSIAVRGNNVAVSGQNVGADNCFYMSTDAGLTFAAPVLKELGAGVLQISTQQIASPADNIWLWMGRSQLWRSTDNGLTFSSVLTFTPGTVGGRAIIALNAHQMVCCDQGQVYTSDDAGLTWTARQNLSSQLGSLGAFGSFGGSVVGALTLQLGTFIKTATGTGAWRSVDYGHTWSPITVNGGFGVDVPGGMNPADTISSFVTRSSRAIGTALKRGADYRETWYNPSTGGGNIIPAGICPPAPANVLMGDYKEGHVRQAFAGDPTDDGALIPWQALGRPVNFGSPQTNAYYRRAVVKVADVLATQQILAQFIFGPIVSVPPRTLTKTLTVPVDVGLGLGFGIQPFGTSPFGGVQWNSEVDLTADLGMIATNARGILSGTGKIRIRGLEWHGRAKPLRKVSVFT